MRPTRLDIAARDPATLARCYQTVFGTAFREVGRDSHLGIVGGLEVFVCPREAAGVPADADGVHQLHFECGRDLAGLLERARSCGCAVEKVDFGGGGAQYRVRDPEGHPWILREA